VTGREKKIQPTSEKTSQFNPGSFPTVSGVYLMRGEKDEVLYVGKANNLRSRLRSYFSSSGDGRAHIRFLVCQIRKVETIVTDTEKEALLLENTLIKKHRPRYNIRLRDDKTYVSLRIDFNEEYPFMQVVRRVKKDGATYFGPYSSSGAVRETLKKIYRIFPLRHYPMERCRRRSRPCLYYQIGQCSAPCHGKISREDYMKQVNGAISLLEGREKDLMITLKGKMREAAVAMRFEEAARLRDQIKALELTAEKQKVSDAQGVDQDVIGLYREGGIVEIAVLFVRGGSLISRRDFSLEWRLEADELLSSFLQQYYGGDVYIPDRILVRPAPDSLEAIQGWLSDRNGRKVRVIVPMRGANREMIELAERNARESCRQRENRREDRENVLREIQKHLGLRRVPRKMECFDVSNVQGRFSVGSMSVFLHGEPAKNEYRRFRIKSVSGADDFASLAEVLRRRLRRGLREDNLPDFILLDGGRGQLSGVFSVLRELGLEEKIDLAGMAKSRVKADARERFIERSEERFFLPGEIDPVTFPEGLPALFMLEKLRNEAHRFAVTYHRKMRGRGTLRSSLEEIPGIGPKRKKNLLKHFGSMKKIGEATLEELSSCPGLSSAAAEAVFRFFRKGQP
jgi:excinuclease ABC subunit C